MENNIILLRRQNHQGILTKKQRLYIWARPEPKPFEFGFGIKSD
jgi:hypothetical protein